MTRSKCLAQARVRAKAISCHDLTEADERTGSFLEMMERVVASIEPPCGIFAANDVIARELVEHALAAGRAIPDKIAVVGVDDNPEACELSPIPISSVALDLEGMGFEAAGLLDRLLRRHPAPVRPLRIPPLGVVERLSSAHRPSKDDLVTAALRRIRFHPDLNLDVTQLAEWLGVSRRTLEARFRKTVKYSPYEAIQTHRIERAKELLARTDFDLIEITRRVGFSDRTGFARVFAQIVGTPPAAYRKARTDGDGGDTPPPRP